MRKTEVYQVRLDSQEKKQAFAVFKQLGITPAQAVRLFFKQVVLTKSIPFAIENQSINTDTLLKPKKSKLDQDYAVQHDTALQHNTAQSSQVDPDHNEHEDIFAELNAILGESQQDNP
ncbi:type II toxin-antitoxin system RelB/DinJ family antitoxin [Acinetobacter larvae]|uniref:RelB/DinJ family addiction module antitoxin n=1 Tax=Acinetobacter larvae TaxID=1789224 RepID=A0A1B2M012_9GAMM|nr:type II toxin-antitoxin system RelB/DinJ family antitoxin [Acinetobacter larvae]AOA58501.1 RelB/DinJ family addiction module antitoxin [Acinetobacter larvae]